MSIVHTAVKLLKKISPSMSLLTALLLLGPTSATIAQPFFFNFEQEETGNVLAFMELPKLPVDTADDIRRIRFLDPMAPSYSLDLRLSGSFYDRFDGVIVSDGMNGLAGPGSLTLDAIHQAPAWLNEQPAAHAVFSFRFGESSEADSIGDQWGSGSVTGNWIGVTDDPFVCTPINALQGDLNGSGSVDFSDFLRLSANFGEEFDNYADGDVTCDGTVDFADFLELSANFGKSLAASGQSDSLSTTGAPEPSAKTCAFIAFACLTMISRRRECCIT